MTDIAFIGLGNMGRPMARNLVKAGHAVSGFDQFGESLQAASRDGIAASSSIESAIAGAEIVITMLPGPAEVEAVLLGPGGVLDSLAAGALLMDMSTVEPDTSDRLAAAAAERGLRFVDAPVGRLASHADRAESLFMVGASEADFAHPLR